MPVYYAWGSLCGITTPRRGSDNVMAPQVNRCRGGRPIDPREYLCFPCTQEEARNAAWEAHHQAQQMRAPPVVPPMQRKTDLVCVLALAFGCLSIWLFGCLTGPTAVILAMVGMARLENEPHLKGKSQAVIGMLFGLLSTAAAIYNLQKLAEALKQSGL